ncbi:hypothetical protein PCE1_000654 [Barthelona sp. PCE]
MNIIVLQAVLIVFIAQCYGLISEHHSTNRALVSRDISQADQTVFIDVDRPNTFNIDWNDKGFTRIKFMGSQPNVAFTTSLDTFHMEYDAGCYRDYLSIVDLVRTIDRSKRFCGDSPPFHRVNAIPSFESYRTSFSVLIRNNYGPIQFSFTTTPIHLASDCNDQGFLIDGECVCLGAKCDPTSTHYSLDNIKNSTVEVTDVRGSLSMDSIIDEAHMEVVFPTPPDNMVYRFIFEDLYLGQHRDQTSIVFTDVDYVNGTDLGSIQDINDVSNERSTLYSSADSTPSFILFSRLRNGYMHMRWSLMSWNDTFDDPCTLGRMISWSMCACHGKDPIFFNDNGCNIGNLLYLNGDEEKMYSEFSFSAAVFPHVTSFNANVTICPYVFEPRQIKPRIVATRSIYVKLLHFTNATVELMPGKVWDPSKTPVSVTETSYFDLYSPSCTSFMLKGKNVSPELKFVSYVYESDIEHHNWCPSGCGMNQRCTLEGCVCKQGYKAPDCINVDNILSINMDNDAYDFTRFNVDYKGEGFKLVLRGASSTKTRATISVYGAHHAGTIRVSETAIRTIPRSYFHTGYQVEKVVVDPNAVVEVYFRFFDSFEISVMMNGTVCDCVDCDLLTCACLGYQGDRCGTPLPGIVTERKTSFEYNFLPFNTPLTFGVKLGADQCDDRSNRAFIMILDNSTLQTDPMNWIEVNKRRVFGERIPRAVYFDQGHGDSLVIHNENIDQRIHLSLHGTVVESLQTNECEGKKGWVRVIDPYSSKAYCAITTKHYITYASDPYEIYYYIAYLFFALAFVIVFVVWYRKRTKKTGNAYEVKRISINEAEHVGYHTL